MLTFRWFVWRLKEANQFYYFRTTLRVALLHRLLITLGGIVSIDNFTMENGKRHQVTIQLWPITLVGNNHLVSENRKKKLFTRRRQRYNFTIWIDVIKQICFGFLGLENNCNETNIETYHLCMDWGQILPHQRFPRTRTCHLTSTGKTKKKC